MKQLIVLFVITAMIFSCSNNRGWTAKDRTKFINDCTGAAKTMGEDKARAYCECMQPKVEAKYPTVAEANRLTGTEFQSAEWTTEVKKCLGMDTDINTGNPTDNTSGVNNDNTDNMSGGWTAGQRTQFVTDCYNAAKDGMGEEKAKSYCECMQPKLEAKYGSFAEANKISQTELQSEEWLKEVRACLGY